MSLALLWNCFRLALEIPRLNVEGMELQIFVFSLERDLLGFFKPPKISPLD